jgi:RNA-splicing ligase RtcB
MGWTARTEIESVHNYIGDDNIIRKGAIEARLGQYLIIPMNMRDGFIIGKGKGNPDWNCSAPHGAGRTMSRSQAFKTLKLSDFQDAMDGIYTTTATEETLDESPMAYKPMDEILESIKDTVEVLEVIKPVYNFKASEQTRRK